MLRPSLMLAIGLGCALACGDSVAPLGDPVPPEDDFTLPPADTSLDPGRLSVGGYIATPCDLGLWGNGLAGLRERNAWALVDVLFSRAAPDGSPSREDSLLVTSHGGRVLYEFHVPAVRARMVLSNVPSLVADGFWVSVRDVPDPTRYDVPLDAGFTHPVSEADSTLFVSLGGRVTYRSPFDWLAGILPDRSIPPYRAQPDARYVEADGVACLAAAAE
jgi:hypothetical protein